MVKKVYLKANIPRKSTGIMHTAKLIISVLLKKMNMLAAFLIVLFYVKKTISYIEQAKNLQINVLHHFLLKRNVFI